MIQEHWHKTLLFPSGACEGLAECEFEAIVTGLVDTT